MNRYTLTAAQAGNYPHPHPERTASRPATGFLNLDTIYQVWSNRPALARSIRMQQKREHRPDDWRPLVKLKDGEGF